MILIEFRAVNPYPCKRPQFNDERGYTVIDLAALVNGLKASQ
jgi:hypothetical protein